MIPEAIILTVVTASTPILLAAIGELVVERSGVLNLGVEGMMLCGAVAGFAVAFSTGSTLLGLVAAMAAGVATAMQPPARVMRCIWAAACARLHHCSAKLLKQISMLPPASGSASASASRQAAARCCV